MNLPVELIDIILSNIDSQRYIARCASVCRLWYRIARPKLYRSIRLYTDRQVNMFIQSHTGTPIRTVQQLTVAIPIHDTMQWDELRQTLPNLTSVVVQRNAASDTCGLPSVEQLPWWERVTVISGWHWLWQEDSMNISPYYTSLVSLHLRISPFIQLPELPQLRVLELSFDDVNEFIGIQTLEKISKASPLLEVLVLSGFMMQNTHTDGHLRNIRPPYLLPPPATASTSGAAAATTTAATVTASITPASRLHTLRIDNLLGIQSSFYFYLARKYPHLVTLGLKGIIPFSWRPEFLVELDHHRLGIDWMLQHLPHLSSLSVLVCADYDTDGLDDDENDFVDAVIEPGGLVWSPNRLFDLDWFRHHHDPLQHLSWYSSIYPHELRINREEQRQDGARFSGSGINDDRLHDDSSSEDSGDSGSASSRQEDDSSIIYVDLSVPTDTEETGIMINEQQQLEQQWQHHETVGRNSSVTILESSGTETLGIVDTISVNDTNTSNEDIDGDDQQENVIIITEEGEREQSSNGEQRTSSTANHADIVISMQHQAGNHAEEDVSDENASSIYVARECMSPIISFLRHLTSLSLNFSDHDEVDVGTTLSSLLKYYHHNQPVASLIKSIKVGHYHRFIKDDSVTSSTILQPPSTINNAAFPFFAWIHSFPSLEAITVDGLFIRAIQQPTIDADHHGSINTVEDDDIDDTDSVVSDYFTEGLNTECVALEHRKLSKIKLMNCHVSGDATLSSICACVPSLKDLFIHRVVYVFQRLLSQTVLDQMKSGELPIVSINARRLALDQVSFVSLWAKRTNSLQRDLIPVDLKVTETHDNGNMIPLNIANTTSHCPYLDFVCNYADRVHFIWGIL